MKNATKYYLTLLDFARLYYNSPPQGLQVALCRAYVRRSPVGHVAAAECGQMETRELGCPHVAYGSQQVLQKLQ
jgi:hypothetical protein